jgi:hypothetical protein
LKGKEHDPDTPFFFRHFVDALFRLFYIRNKHLLIPAMKRLEASIEEHFKPMMTLRKLPKSIIHDESLYTEKISSVSVDVSYIQEYLKSVRCRIKSKDRFLTLKDIYDLLEVPFGVIQNAKIDVKSDWQLLVSVLEHRFDPEDSLKKIDHKLKILEENELRNKSRIERHMQLKASQFSMKLSIEMFDHEWAEIIAIFYLRSNELVGKDKKFESKAKSLLLTLVETLKQSEYEPAQKPRRTFPISKKDFEYIDF